jgi:hypothetical protein
VKLVGGDRDDALLPRPRGSRVLGVFDAWDCQSDHRVPPGVCNFDQTPNWRSCKLLSNTSVKELCRTGSSVLDCDGSFGVVQS